MMLCPHEVAAETINQLALTFGTLLSSQSTDAHRWKSLDRLRGNLINATGWPRQLQIVSALPFRILAGDARITASALAEVSIRGLFPRAVQCLKPSGPAAVRFPSGHGRSYVVIAARVKPAGQCSFR